MNVSVDYDSKRIAWIDWMKAIGIYFIVLGHFFPIGYEYVYVFNVPLFFILSGFLSHKENNEKLFWKKLFYNLCVPMAIICGINLLVYASMHMLRGDISLSDILMSVLAMIVGMQGKGIDVLGLGTMWFVYTLIISKILFQKLPSPICSVLAIVFSFITIMLSDIKMPASAVINTMSAFPLFMLGYLLRKYRSLASTDISKVVLYGIIIVSSIIVFLCGYTNGYVQMFQNRFGQNFLLYILGAMVGTLGIWGICRLLGNANKYIQLVSVGTIVILGFHRQLIPLFQHLLPKCMVTCILSSFIIVLFFIPLISIARNYFPSLVGKMRK